MSVPITRQIGATINATTVELNSEVRRSALLQAWP